jgi:hypothetical protein
MRLRGRLEQHEPQRHLLVQHIDIQLDIMAVEIIVGSTLHERAPSRQPGA